MTNDADSRLKSDFDAFLAIKQSALDSIPTGLCLCAADGVLLRYNRRAVELWGRPPKLGDRAELGAPFRRYAADGSPLPFSATPVARVLRTGERLLGVELIIERPDSSRVPVLMNVYPLTGLFGRIPGAVCSFQELTQRKIAEEALRASAEELQTVVNQTPFMLVRCSSNMRYRFISRAYAQLIGRQREDVLGKTIAEILGEKGLATLLPNIETVLQGHPVEFECDIEFPGVGTRSLFIAYRPEADTAGQVDGWIASLLDITEQKRADQARLQLASIVESTADVIIGNDLDGIIVSWNPAATHLFGYAAQEAVGRSVTMLFPDELVGEEKEILEPIRRGQRIEHFETVRRAKDGRLIDISLTVSPVKDKNGAIIGGSQIARDISGRKRTEAILARRAEEQTALYEFTDKLYRASCLTDIYEAALDAIIGALHCSRASVLRSDSKGMMDFVAWRGLSDRYRSAVDGHSPWRPDEINPEPICIADIERADLPDGLKAAARQEGIQAIGFIPLMAAGRLAGRFATYYEEPHKLSGEEIDLALTVARQLGFGIERMQAEDRRSAIEAELRTLSEKLEAEVERRTLERDRIWNVSEDLFAVSNFAGYFLSMNPAWTRLLGWTEDEIKSMHVSELRHPDDAAKSMAGRAELAAGVPTVRMENRFRHKDGSWRWLHWTMTEHDGLIYVAGRHVTKEREAAAALERAQQQAAHLQKMEAIGQLTGGIAHDFNNLLMIVSGHAQNLLLRLTGAKDVRAVQAIEMAATRGENLTRQLLSFARTLPLDPTVISLAEVVHNLRDVLSGSMHVNIQFAIEVPGTTWPVRVDKSELELALVNLVVNARDAMPDRGHLSISAANVRLNEGDTPEGVSGDAVALIVADNGCGIAPELLPRVVEPFFTTKSVDKGTGLGLSQVYGFARRSGGTMLIASEPGRGTKVTIYLPRSHAAVAAASPEESVPRPAVGRQTVLVVEDNSDVSDVAVSLLEELGYQTIAVDSATAALKVLASKRDINLVFSDVVLPGQTDGLALARMVTERYPQVPVVLTTGYTKVFDADPEFPVLRKPYQIAALGRVIHEALHPAMASGPALSS